MVGVLVTVVLPQITNLLTSLDQELPVYTNHLFMFCYLDCGGSRGTCRGQGSGRGESLRQGSPGVLARHGIPFQGVLLLRSSPPSCEIPTG